MTIVRCHRCGNGLRKDEVSSYVRGYPFPLCDHCQRAGEGGDVRRKPRVVHYGNRDGLGSTETLCGKRSGPQGYLTTLRERVTCKNCIAAMRGEEVL